MVLKVWFEIILGAFLHTGLAREDKQIVGRIPRTWDFFLQRSNLDDDQRHSRPEQRAPTANWGQRSGWDGFARLLGEFGVLNR